jgi:trehalose 6-phosphate synthase/phosphatase
MLLPKLIREKRPNATIGFFLHIPFPSFEIFRFLPTKWRRNILEGLLGADLIGFHTYDYTHAFLRCSLRILGLEHHVGQIQTSDRVIKVDSFPMGIDFEKFQHEAHQPKVIAQRKKIKKDLEPFKVIFSVDRLDYTKGILNRLQGFDLFLENFPKYRKKVVLMLVVVPSRTPVEQYRQMKRQIDEYIGRINGKYASLDWTPILYQYRSFDFSTLVALYSLSDIALITPLRDGMNLIAKEYLASRIDRHGSLILSEMAGAARELGEAILINPNYKEEIAEAIKIALEMPLTEQSHRLQVLQNRLKTYDVVRWGEDYFNELREIKEEQKKYITKLITPSDQSQMLTAYRKAKKRILFLDYDGTLIPFSSTPDMATPPRHLIQLLKRLTLDSRNQIVLISGRNRKLLEEWLRGMPIDLIAEHGAWIKIKNKPWKLLESVPIDWKPKIIDILKTFADRLPGAFVEEKDFSVVWHFRKADPELAKLRQRELLDDLVNFTASSDIQVVPGNKIVEIRTAGIHKGNAALEFLNKRSFDFIFAIGDDQTDEDLFSVLPPKAYSFRVGIKQTLARFNLSLQAQAIELIQRMGK